MAYYFLFPESDTTLYSHPNRKELNTGADEILEILKEKGNEDDILYPSRVVLKFKNDELKSTISNVVGHSKFQSAKVNLQLMSSQAQNIASTIVLEAFLLAESFDEGTGKYLNIPTGSNGASWKFRNNTITATEWTTSSFSAGTTGSINSSLITQGGGVWFTGSGFQTEQQFLVGDSLDTNFDVTTMVQKHSASLFNSSAYPTGVTNNGFLIKKTDTIEIETSSSLGDLAYFSTDTHTIYPPRLCFKWDDSSFIDAATGSAKNEGELNVSLYRNQEEYNQNDEATFRIHVRDKYPTRTFTTSSNFLNVGYFTTSSFYSIRDAHTEEEIIPFDDNYTKLSADSKGMYFKLFMKGLQPERYYRILFKHTNLEGTIIYDDNYFFKIIR